MIAPLRFALIALLVVLPTRLPAADAPVRDWKKAPAIVEVDTAHDIYALGDVHGDSDRLVALLVAAKIIPADPGPPEMVRWQAGKATLVCTGDVIDKWDQSVRVLLLLRALAVEADKAGGRVIVTLGNHEAEFLADPRNRKAAEFLKDLQDRGIDPSDVAAGKDALGLGVYLRGLPAAARVNDWFFAHAGNTRGRTLAQLRSDIETGMDRDGYRTPSLLADDGLLEARLHPRPWWEKEGDTGPQARDRLRGLVGALGVAHLVVGHQPGSVTFADGFKPQRGEVIAHNDGLIFLIDAGMSRGVGDSNGALLRIRKSDKGTRVERIPATGATVLLWEGR